MPRDSERAGGEDTHLPEHDSEKQKRTKKALPPWESIKVPPYREENPAAFANDQEARKAILQIIAFDPDTFEPIVGNTDKRAEMLGQVDEEKPERSRPGFNDLIHIARRLGMSDEQVREFIDDENANVILRPSFANPKENPEADSVFSRTEKLEERVGQLVEGIVEDAIKTGLTLEQMNGKGIFEIQKQLQKRGSTEQLLKNEKVTRDLLIDIAKKFHLNTRLVKEDPTGWVESIFKPYLVKKWVGEFRDIIKNHRDNENTVKKIESAIIADAKQRGVPLEIIHQSGIFDVYREIEMQIEFVRNEFYSKPAKLVEPIVPEAAPVDLATEVKDKQEAEKDERVNKVIESIGVVIQAEHRLKDGETLSVEEIKRMREAYAFAKAFYMKDMEEFTDRDFRKARDYRKGRQEAVDKLDAKKSEVEYYLSSNEFDKIWAKQRNEPIISSEVKMFYTDFENIKGHYLSRMRNAVNESDRADLERELHIWERKLKDFEVLEKSRMFEPRRYATIATPAGVKSTGLAPADFARRLQGVLAEKQDKKEAPWVNPLEQRKQLWGVINNTLTEIYRGQIPKDTEERKALWDTFETRVNYLSASYGKMRVEHLPANIVAKVERSVTNLGDGAAYLYQKLFPNEPLPKRLSVFSAERWEKEKKQVVAKTRREGRIGRLEKLMAQAEQLGIDPNVWGKFRNKPDRLSELVESIRDLAKDEGTLEAWFDRARNLELKELEIPTLVGAAQGLLERYGALEKTKQAEKIGTLTEYIDEAQPLIDVTELRAKAERLEVIDPNDISLFSQATSKLFDEYAALENQEIKNRRIEALGTLEEQFHALVNMRRDIESFVDSHLEEGKNRDELVRMLIQDVIKENQTT